MKADWLRQPYSPENYSKHFQMEFCFSAALGQWYTSPPGFLSVSLASDKWNGRRWRSKGNVLKKKK